MPELPEVETVKRAIKQHLIKQKLQAVQMRRSGCRRPFDQKALDRLKGFECTAFERRGKLLMIHLTNNQNTACIFIHLGMSGSVQCLSKDEAMDLPYAQHDHLIVIFDSHQLRYNDPRRFGWVDVRFNEEITDYPFLQKLGIEPLSDAFTGQHLYKLLQMRHSDIKSALLNQQIIAGLGNIYVCEILFIAKIHPKSIANRIPFARISHLHQAIIDVLTRAIIAGGSSIKDFKHSDGKLGYFQHQFLVYGKDGQICPFCQKQQLIEKCTLGGRTTFFCKKCQKLYKKP